MNPIAILNPTISLPFKATMARAVMDDRKTQTRRIMNLRHAALLDPSWPFALSHHDPKMLARCPYGKPDSLAWGREPWRVNVLLDREAPRNLPFEHSLTVLYEAGGSMRQDEHGIYVPDDTYPEKHGVLPEWAGKLRPAMFMPKAASRMLLKIICVRLQRLNDITEADAIAEGCPGGHGSIPGYEYAATAIEHFMYVIRTIHGPEIEKLNPWVWVIEFKRLRPEVCQHTKDVMLPLDLN